jgi:hypothetical protein
MVAILTTISIFIVGQAIAGIIWGVRLEGKVNLGDQRVTDLKELINQRFDSTDERLKRIERSLNGHLRHD